MMRACLCFITVRNTDNRISAVDVYKRVQATETHSDNMSASTLLARHVVTLVTQAAALNDSWDPGTLWKGIKMKGLN